MQASSAQLFRQVAGRDDLGSVPVTFEPVNGLAYGSHRPALERERCSVDDRLIAVVQRAEPSLEVRRQKLTGCAEDGDVPTAGPRVAEEVIKRRAGLPWRPDRVSADDRAYPPAQASYAARWVPWDWVCC